MRRRSGLECWAMFSVFAGLVLLGSSAAAQEGMPRPAVVSGARVRVSYPGINRRVGTLVALSRDTLVARWESGATSRMALRRVSQLDVSAGRFGNPRAGAALGGLLGVALGVTIAVVDFNQYSKCRETSDSLTTKCGDESTGLAPVIIGPAIGMVVGGVVGTVVWRTDRWRAVLGGGHTSRVGPIPARLGGGTRIGLAHTF